MLGLAEAATPYASPLVPGGFLTEGVGFGHVVFATTAFDESHAFLTDGLGLGQSDWLEMEIAAGIELEVRFYHCNARHHTRGRSPRRRSSCRRSCTTSCSRRTTATTSAPRSTGRGRADLPIPNGLGRHDNDGMFSFYVASPAGFQVEVGHGARVITDDWDDNRRYDRISAWGHQPLRQP